MLTEDYIRQCNEALKGNLSKIVISLFIMFIGTQFVSYGMIFFFLLRDSSILSMALIFFIVLCIFAAIFSFQYGFSVLILLFSRKEKPVLGHLFCGFRTFGRMFKASIPYSLIFIVSILLAVFVLSSMSDIELISVPDLSAIASGQEVPDNGSFYISPILILVSMGIVVLSLILYFPFALFNYDLFDAPEVPVIQIIKKSIELTVHNAGFIIKNCFSYAWIELFISAGLFAVQYFVPVSENSFLLNFVLSIASFVFPILVYVLYLKVIMMLAVCHDYLTGKTVEYELIPENINSSNEQIGENDGNYTELK